MNTPRRLSDSQKPTQKLHQKNHTTAPKHNQTLTTETHPLAPTNPYGETKRVMEGMLRWYGQAYGIRSIALRYFNAAGADPEGELGEDHRPEVHLIPLTLFAAVGRRESIAVFGTDYDTPAIRIASINRRQPSTLLS